MLYPEDYEEQPAKRSGFWGWALFGWIVGVSFLTFGLLQCAYASPTFRSENTNGTPIVLKLTEEPCTNETILAFLRARVPSAYVERFKAAVLTWEGKDWASCWIEVGGAIYSIDEEGAPLQPVPRDLFKDDSV